MAIKVYRGTTKRVYWRFKNRNLDGSTSLVDLTGMRFQLTISERVPADSMEDGAVILTKDTANNDGLSVDVPNSMVVWKPTKAESRLIPRGKYAATYQLELVSAPDDEDPWAWGKVDGVGEGNIDA